MIVILKQILQIAGTSETCPSSKYKIRNFADVISIDRGGQQLSRNKKVISE
jgi:hypothetical protein